jgi:hypothetical protein
MNTVLLNKEVLRRNINVEGLQEKTKFYFNVALTLGKIIEVSNIQNCIFTLLTMFTEIES